MDVISETWLADSLSNHAETERWEAKILITYSAEAEIELQKH